MRVAVASGIAVGSGKAVAGTAVDSGSTSAEVAAATAAAGCGVDVGFSVGVGAAVGCGVALGCGVVADAGVAIAVGTTRGAVVGTAVARGLGSASLGTLSIDCVATDLAGSLVPDRAEFAKNAMTMQAVIVAAILSARRMAGLVRWEEVMGAEEPLRDSVIER
jgi:hypothetical protein